MIGIYVRIKQLAFYQNDFHLSTLVDNFVDKTFYLRKDDFN